MEKGTTTNINGTQRLTNGVKCIQIVIEMKSAIYHMAMSDFEKSIKRDLDKRLRK